MDDIFTTMAEKSGKDTNVNYGMSGDMKKTQFMLELIGVPHDADTLKCVLTAAEQGMEMNCYGVGKEDEELVRDGVKEFSPFSLTPYLKEADFFTSGSDAITAFIDARGLGYSLTPKNATLAAIQNYWVDIAITNVAPLVNRIVEETIANKISNSSYQLDAEVVNENLEKLQVYFDALERQLHNNKYIVCAKYTWADLHWTAYAHLCEVSGCDQLINQRKKVKKWFEGIKSRTSQCGQNIVAYDVLPGREEMLSGKLNSVEISDF